ncbi:MAG: prolyl oligopeptidase family serine peptidase [Phycisphaerales bacterium]|nr:prolyl oligopeptidase family serine peptidase [Phycisphaerales bacterium]
MINRNNITTVAMLTMLLVGLSGCRSGGAGQERDMGMEFAAGYGLEAVTVDDVEMRGVIYRPAGHGEASLPIVLFLHGYGECGRDGQRHLTVGLPPAIMLEPERWPFVVVMPQKPEFNVEWEMYEAQVMELLEVAAARYGGDDSRVAITGLSQGGHGTIAIGSRHPERFRCAAPVCGYVAAWNSGGVKRPGRTTGNDPVLRAAADGLAQMPVRIFHGGRDSVVPVSESQALRDALEAQGADVTLAVYADADHNSWDQAYRESGVWTWIQACLDKAE